MALLDDVVLRMQWERAKGEMKAFQVAVNAADEDESDEAAEVINAIDNCVEEVESNLED